MRLRLPYLKPRRIGCMIMDHATIRNAKRKADTTTTKKKHEKKPKKKEEKRKKRGKKRKLCGEYEIECKDIEEMKRNQENRCEVSGIELEWKTKSPYKASVDRIDANRGYTRDNVRLVCWIVNCGMNKFEMEDFLNMCKSVANYNIYSEK